MHLTLHRFRQCVRTVFHNENRTFEESQAIAGNETTHFSSTQQMCVRVCDCFILFITRPLRDGERSERKTVNK